MRSELLVVLRSLARARGYTLAVVGILALGLGCTAAIYSLVQEALFRSRGVREPETLVKIGLTAKDQPTLSPYLFQVHFNAYREARLKTLTGIAGSMQQSMNLMLPDDSILGVQVGQVTLDFLDTLGLVPSLGRGFLPGEDQPGAAHVAILTDRLWRGRFAADPDILSKTIRLNGRDYTVIGVLPEGVFSPVNYTGELLYVPLSADTLALSQATWFNAITNVVGRLKSGTTPEQVEAELRSLHPGKDLPVATYFADYQPIVRPIKQREEYASLKRYHAMSVSALGASALLYLIAVVNAAGLMLVRTLGRQRELGVRLALGASRWRVARPLLWEGWLLSTAGTLLGLVVARWVFPALLTLAPAQESWTKVSLDGSALAILAGLGLLTGLGIAAGATWQVSRLNLNNTLKAGGNAAGESRRQQVVRGTLVAAEAALAVCLLAGAGLMLRTFQQILDFDPGYDPARKLIVQFNLPQTKITDPKVRVQTYHRLAETLATVPGVEAATLGAALISQEALGGRQETFKIAGRPEEHRLPAPGSAVQANYFDLLGIPTKLGRPLSTIPDSGPPVIVINETFARQFFRGENPIGQRLELPRNRVWEIVGVVGDIRSPREDVLPRYYFLQSQTSPYFFQAQLRLAAEPDAKLHAAIRRALYDLDPSFVVLSVQSVDRGLKNAVSMERFILTNLQVLAALALLLAALGLFAMMAYSVAQRRLEFGIRLALGASPRSIQRLVLRRGLMLTILGVTGGLGLALALSRFLESLLYQTKPHDPLTYTVVGLLMLAVAALACWWPARRSAQVDINRLLRPD